MDRPIEIQDPTPAVKQFALQIDPSKDGLVRAIYQIDGSTLKLSFRTKTRFPVGLPVDFSSGDASGQAVFIIERIERKRKNIIWPKSE